MNTESNEAPHSDDEVSLEELAAAYARALGVTSPAPKPEAAEPLEPLIDGGEEPLLRVRSEETEGFAVSPTSVIEAALFVGHPENQPLSASILAGLMRGVTADEVDSIVKELNASYEQSDSALRIMSESGGYRMGLAESVDRVRTAFYGRVRDARLNQAAIDVLALIAYQPGVTAATLDIQRGKGSASVAAQLVRRKLVELRRETDSEGRKVQRYFAAARFLKLFGLKSLEDLPQVDDNLLPPE